jgi:hypothetical protein
MGEGWVVVGNFGNAAVVIGALVLTRNYLKKN